MNLNRIRHRVEQLRRQMPRSTPSGPPVVTLRSVGPDPVSLSWRGLVDSIRDTRPGDRSDPNKALLASLFLVLWGDIESGTPAEAGALFADEINEAIGGIVGGERAVDVARQVLPGLIQRIDDILAQAADENDA